MMNGAKQSGISDCRIAALLVMAVVFSVPSSANAQSAGYAPPPMFEDMTPPMVRPEGQNGYIVTPKTSERPVEEMPGRPSAVTPPQVSINPDAPRVVPATPPATAVGPAPVVIPAPPQYAPRPPIVPAAPAPVTAPVEKPKMMEPIVEKSSPKKKPVSKKQEEPRTESVKTPPPVPAAVAPTPAPTPSVAPTPVPAPVITAPPVMPPSVQGPGIAPVPRDPSQSAITGPKTMPALPTTKVDEQVTFDAPTTAETILERHQKEAEGKAEETLTPIVPRPNPNVAPTNFDASDRQGALKKIIPFQPGQIGLAATDADPVIAGVVKELDVPGRTGWRVQIRAFATPHGTGLSSDRRIALSRALSLRSSMISQGVPASKIDVMAEGLQTQGAGPGDRIDLYLYEPSQR